MSEPRVKLPQVVGKGGEANDAPNKRLLTEKEWVESGGEWRTSYEQEAKLLEAQDAKSYKMGLEDGYNKAREGVK